MARYDPAERRRAQRSGRERGCWVYVPADELRKAGIDPDGPVPFYRVWGGRRGGLTLRMYASYRPPSVRTVKRDPDSSPPVQQGDI